VDGWARVAKKGAPSCEKPRVAAGRL